MTKTISTIEILIYMYERIDGDKFSINKRHKPDVIRRALL